LSKAARHDDAKPAPENRISVVAAALTADLSAQGCAWHGRWLYICAGTFYGRARLFSASELPAYDPAQKMLAVVDRATGVWNQVSLASILTGSQTVQIVTAAGDVTVQPNDGLIILNKTVGAATNVILPAAANKVGRVKVVDWKNDSDVNNVTFVPNGSEKIQGLSGWKLAGQGASVILDPISGLGYAI
jgi:hypothetical protein